MPTKAKARELRSAAPSASPAPGTSRSSRSRSSKTVDSESTDDDATEQNAVAEEGEEDVDDSDVAGPATDGDDEVAAEEEEEGSGSAESGSAKPSMQERMEKMKELRNRMNKSTADNRKDLIADHQKSKVTAKELARLEKQRKLAQTLRLKAEADEEGVDMERKKNWEWSIEQNERWQQKVDEAKAKGDSSFHNAEDDAFKRYNRNIKTTKPDLLQYQRAKEAAMGLAPGTLVATNATNQTLALAGPSNKGLTASEDLYRGADTLAYGDNKPSEDAIDRVSSKINQDIGKKKRKAKDDSNEPVTYINERNKVFNKKVARYFDKYTKEIRASFERGTAL